MARRELNLDLKTILKFESGFEALKWLLKSIWKCKVPIPKYENLSNEKTLRHAPKGFFYRLRPFAAFFINKY